MNIVDIVIGTLIAVAGYFLNRLISSLDDFKKETQRSFSNLRERLLSLEKELSFMNLKIETVASQVKDSELEVLRKTRTYVESNVLTNRRLQETMDRSIEMYLEIQKEIAEMEALGKVTVKNMTEIYGKVRVIEPKIDKFLATLEEIKKKGKSNG